jgi:1-deoxy-D-xylulose-5-phosphate reductoisomerase
MNSNSLPKRLIILGSTGSIGCNTLDVIRTKRDYFQVKALSCHNNYPKLLAQVREFEPEAICITGQTEKIPPLPPKLKIYRESTGLSAMIKEVKADMVLNGIAGAGGLLPSLASIQSHKDLALANKETVVMAGEMLFHLAAQYKVNIIPVDSEHSALFQLSRHYPHQDIVEIILTASGGAVRDIPLRKLNAIKISTLLNHPNWKMGTKITIDSATMANKALEVIEAHHFFKLNAAQIKVVIHPQSYVHSLIRTVDGSLYAQLSKPDMRIPIQNALTYPKLLPIEFGRLDLEHCTISFLPVDKKKYPMLDLGYRALAAGPAYPIVFNAANEVAVACFLKTQISFQDISRITEKTLALSWTNVVNSSDEILEIDEIARKKAFSFIERRKF